MNLLQRLMVTCAEGYESLAFDEIKKTDSSVESYDRVDPGIFTVESELDFPEFSRRLRLTGPTFTRHIQPVDESPAISGKPNDLALYKAIVEKWSTKFSRKSEIAVQVRKSGGLAIEYTPYGVKEAIDPLIEGAGAVTAIQGAEFAISVFISKAKAFLGFSSTKDNLSDWAGGAMRLGRAPNQASRSRFKLEEACLAFELELPIGAKALDLGAAPGGWTSYLLDKGLRVTSVDTGDMQPELLKSPNLRFIKANALTVNFPPGSFDLLVCDMSWNPIQTARNLIRLSDCLKPGGTAIVTIKFMGKKVRQTIDEFLQILEPQYESRRVKQLFHNRDEATAYLIKV